MRLVLLLFLLGGALWAQEPEQEGEEEEGCTVIEIGDGTSDDSYDVQVDPFPLPEGQAEEPNRPPPVRVGEWEPPDLDAVARHELEEHLARRREAPADAGVRYRLAEFYFAHGWYPQAEAEFLRCAELEPDSIRPWEGLLRVYRAEEPEVEEEVRALGGWLVVRSTGRAPSWLGSEEERAVRITRAYRELLRRRPDDVARRREFLAHLKGLYDFRGIAEQARAILAQLPGDVETRYDLAEALRRKPEGFAEAVELLEENVRRAPDHVPSLLRLARMLAVRDGTKAATRIEELEKRAFFHLFVREELAPIGYREDLLAIARRLAGPSLAARLWDARMMPARFREAPWTLAEQAPYFQRWVVLSFTHSGPQHLQNERLQVIRALARRADEGAAAVLVSFLWHLDDFEQLEVDQLEERRAIEVLERAAVRAMGELGPAGYPAAERFLRAAETAVHRRRAVGILRRQRDPRAVLPLIDALAWDTDEQVSYGVAAALADLGDPRAIDALAAAALDSRRPLERRREAAEALAAFRDARSIETFNRLREQPELALVAAYGLFRTAGDAASLEHLAKALRKGRESAAIVRWLAHCDDARVGAVLIEGLMSVGEPAVRARIVEVLRERYWTQAAERVKAVFLAEAESPAASALAIRELGRMGGTDAADRLLRLLESAKGERWELVAHALAETGDPRGVRLFNRMRILEKDAARRALAAELHARAAARQAQRNRARG